MSQFCVIACSYILAGNYDNKYKNPDEFISRNWAVSKWSLEGFGHSSNLLWTVRKKGWKTRDFLVSYMLIPEFSRLCQQNVWGDYTFLEICMDNQYISVFFFANQTRRTWWWDERQRQALFWPECLQNYTDGSTRGRKIASACWTSGKLLSVWHKENYRELFMEVLSVQFQYFALQ